MTAYANTLRVIQAYVMPSDTAPVEPPVIYFSERHRVTYDHLVSVTRESKIERDEKVERCIQFLSWMRYSAVDTPIQ